MAKIGLLAPFEGLHRESGYHALAALRAALAEFDAAGVEAVPLALDTSGGPGGARRAALKLLRDGSVAAIIGPLSAQDTASVADLIESGAVDWHVPTAPVNTEALGRLTAAIVGRVEGDDVLLAGPQASRLQAAAGGWLAGSGKRVRFAGPEEQLAPADGVVWLGGAESAAAFLAKLRQQYPGVPFWTTSIAGDPVFFALARSHLRGGQLGPVFLCVPLRGSASDFMEWAAKHATPTPSSYAVYQAVRRALAKLSGEETGGEQPGLAVFALDRSGSAELVEFAPFP